MSFLFPLIHVDSPLAMLGLCYYRLGLFRDAERQLASAFRDTPAVLTALLQGKVRGWKRVDWEVGV